MLSSPRPLPMIGALSLLGVGLAGGGCDLGKGDDSGGGAGACPLLTATVDGVESDIAFSITNEARMIASHDPEEETLTVVYTASDWSILIAGFTGETGDVMGALSVADADEVQVIAPVAALTVTAFQEDEVRITGADILATTDAGDPRTIESFDACAAVLITEE